MTEQLELLLRWTLGLQFAFWGLNGFFHWKQIPPSSEVISEFTDACLKSKFLMPTVKAFEIVFGILLLTGIRTLLSLAALAPIIFVISGLHLSHNKNPWPILGSITLPFLILVVFHYEKWQNLFLN